MSPMNRHAQVGSVCRSICREGRTMRAKPPLRGSHRLCHTQPTRTTTLRLTNVKKIRRNLSSTDKHNSLIVVFSRSSSSQIVELIQIWESSLFERVAEMRDES
ncbi:hypothetical protein K1719_041723 [Acacia pycnantha]|nr:hypothetical protein K1719_041723 [Acacia pycnantha]